MKRLKTKCLIRKRIWEVDCLSLDGALAAAFDWKELSNLLEGHGIAVDHSLPKHILEMQVQCAVHRECHEKNTLSCTIETLLNRLYEDLVLQSEGMNHCQIKTIIANVDFSNPSRLGGLFWALGSDPRDEMECARHFLHQRSQVTLLRQGRLLNLERTL